MYPPRPDQLHKKAGIATGMDKLDIILYQRWNSLTPNMYSESQLLFPIPVFPAIQSV